VTRFDMLLDSSPCILDELRSGEVACIECSSVSSNLFASTSSSWVLWTSTFKALTRIGVPHSRREVLRFGVAGVMVAGLDGCYNRKAFLIFAPNLVHPYMHIRTHMLRYVAASWKFG
jgi:hypothetical protein